MIPVTWLDDEFERLTERDAVTPESDHVIDLRDRSIAEGLAEALLADVVDWTDRIVEAEVRAAATEHKLETATANLRRASSDLDAQTAERSRLEQDLNEKTTSLAVELDRRTRAEQRAERAEAALEALKSKHEKAQAALQAELEQHRTSLTALKAMSSRRGRRKLQRLLTEATD